MFINVRKQALLGLCLMAASSLTLTARAANYTPVSGTATSFDKYLIIDKDANVPAASFDFSIAPGEAMAATENSMEVLAGAGTPVLSGPAVFTAGEEAYSSVQSGDSLDLTADEKYAFKTINVDFSSVSFDEPGIYRYVITETPLQEAGAFVQDTEPKYLDVYVTDNNGILEVSSYVLHSSADAPIRNATGGSEDVAEALAAVSDKTTGFINRYQTKDLTITKQVAGNQASKDKYFKYTLKIANAGAGTKLIADVTSHAEAAPLDNAATVYTSEAMAEANNVTMLTCDENGSVEHVFYLKHNQSVTIKQLPLGATYEVSEVKEDYVSEDLAQVDAEQYAANTGTIGSAALTAGFRNTRNGVIPTGIITSVAPYFMIVFIAAAGMLISGRKRMIH